MTAVQELGTHISSMIGNMTVAQELGTRDTYQQHDRKYDSCTRVWHTYQQHVR